MKSKRLKDCVGTKAVRFLCAFIMIISLSACGNLSKQNQRQNFFSTSAELSEAKSYMETAWNLNTDQLPWCRFYEITDPEVLTILIQFKEEDSENFSYGLFCYDVDIEHFYQYRYYDDSEPQLLHVIEKSNDGSFTYLQLNGEDPFGDAISFDIVCDKKGYIKRISLPYWAYDSKDLSIFDYEYKDDSLCVTEYIGSYSDLMNADFSADYESKTVYTYDSDGCLIKTERFESDDSIYESVSYSYNANRERSNIESLYYDELTKVYYERDEQGLVKYVLCENSSGERTEYEIEYADSGMQKIITIR